MTRQGTPPLAARLDSVVLDAGEPGRLARFYAALLDRAITRVDGGFFDVRLDGGLRLCIQHAPDHQPPTWPDDRIPQQAHLDIVVAIGLDAAVERAVALGAERTDHPAPGDWDYASFRTLRDPAGHPFCLASDSWGARTGRA